VAICVGGVDGTNGFRAACGPGGVTSIGRFTVWMLTGTGSYLAILYWSEFTTLVDAIFSPPLPPGTALRGPCGLIYSYVVASRTDQPGNVLRYDRLAGWLAIALWLGSFVWSVTADLVQPVREGDLGAIPPRQPGPRPILGPNPGQIGKIR